jgi:ABC-type uncharacterized transport system involved in gliding motility auxiliary subunit
MSLNYIITEILNIYTIKNAIVNTSISMYGHIILNALYDTKLITFYYTQNLWEQKDRQDQYVTCFYSDSSDTDMLEKRFQKKTYL